MKNVEVGDELVPISKLITMKQILMYADASGDYNPIHIDEEFAKNSQFGKNIGHGMMVAATISELMVRNFADAWYKTGKMKMRFKSPVYPEDKIQTSGSIKKSENVETGTQITCSVQIVRQDGDTIISGETSVTLQNP